MTLHMNPQDHVLDAVLRAQGILADYIEPGPHDCEQTLARLFGILNDEKLMRAVNVLNLKAANELAARSPAA
jgi:hypothetical protein